MRSYSLFFWILGLVAIAQCKGKVDVAVFYGSKCYDSHRFFTTQLAKYYKDLKDVINLRLYPYGKTFSQKVGSDYLFKCQLGPDECETNIVHACAKQYSNGDHDKLVAFTTCFMKTFSNILDGEECALDAGISWTDLSSCVASKEGDKLLHAAGLVQLSEAPELNFVPWIVINGVRSRDAQYHLKAVVCEELKGTLPSTC